jgi:hypothetical protein
VCTPRDVTVVSNYSIPIVPSVPLICTFSLICTRRRQQGPKSADKRHSTRGNRFAASPTLAEGFSGYSNSPGHAHYGAMRFFLFLGPLVALLFTPFRRCLLIMPILLTGVIGGLVAWEWLFKTTGGQYGECTDICFPSHLPGTASSAYMPLWILTVVGIVSVVGGLSFWLIGSALKKQRLQNKR